MLAIRSVAMVFAAVLLAACGGGGSSGDDARPAEPLVLQASATATVEGGPAVTLSLSGGAPHDLPVTWSLSAPVGRLSDVSDAGATYLPPTLHTLADDAPVSVTATTKSGATVSRAIGLYRSALRAQALPDASTEAGDALSVSFEASPVIPLASMPLYATVVDADGVIGGAVTVSASGPAAHGFSLEIGDALPPGTYNGTAEITVCYDAACTMPLPGRPLQVPYSLEVTPNTGLKPLSRWTGISDWETFQGNASHTGYVPVTLNPVTIGQRWVWPAPAVSGNVYPLTHLTTSGGRVHVSSGNVLHVLGEADSIGLWSYDMSGIALVLNDAANAPASTGGKVYVAGGHQSTTYLFAFDGTTGALQFKSLMPSQWETYYAPTVLGDRVYTNGGTYGGLYAFDADSGDEQFFAYAEQTDRWTPAVDEQSAYVFTGVNTGMLRVFDRLTGALTRSIAVPDFSFTGYRMNMAPVLGAAGSVILVSPGTSLARADVGTGTVPWSVSGAYFGNPAYHDGLVHAVNRNPLRLEVRQEATGALQWSWVPPDAEETLFLGDVLLTRNLVFVSTDKAVYAIDRLSHQAVWKHPQPGRLALSANRILYLSPMDGNGQSDGTLIAFNVKGTP